MDNNFNTYKVISCFLGGKYCKCVCVNDADKRLVVNNEYSVLQVGDTFSLDWHKRNYDRNTNRERETTRQFQKIMGIR